MDKSLALIGSDPEVFVSNGEDIHHCIDILGGSKRFPRLVVGGAVQEDNVLFEFNTNPTDDPKEFVSLVRSVLEQGQELLDPHGLFLRLGKSSHVFDTMVGFPEKAFEFGCTPDFNAYGGTQNPVPTSVNPNLRTAGGHVHIGWSHLKPVTKEDQEAVGQMCDYLLGLPSLLEDDDDLRRELYGKSGAIRYKAYGVEYRTLSNYWLASDELIAKIHARAQQAFEQVDKLPVLQALVPQADVQRVINTNDRTTALAMLKVIGHATI